MPFSFRTRLREAMRDTGVSARQLGAVIRPDNPESGRRMIQDYLAAEHPAVPRRARRREIARALGLPEEQFDEDEDPALVAELMRQLTPLIHDVVVDVVERSA